MCINSFLSIAERILSSVFVFVFLTKIYELNFHLEENIKNISVKNYLFFLTLEDKIRLFLKGFNLLGHKN